MVPDGNRLQLLFVLTVAVVDLMSSTITGYVFAFCLCIYFLCTEKKIAALSKKVSFTHWKVLHSHIIHVVHVNALCTVYLYGISNIICTSFSSVKYTSLLLLVCHWPMCIYTHMYCNTLYLNP